VGSRNVVLWGSFS